MLQPQIGHRKLDASSARSYWIPAASRRAKAVSRVGACTASAAQRSRNTLATRLHFLLRKAEGALAESKPCPDWQSHPEPVQQRAPCPDFFCLSRAPFPLQRQLCADSTRSAVKVNGGEPYTG